MRSGTGVKPVACAELAKTMRSTSCRRAASNTL